MDYKNNNEAQVSIPLSFMSLDPYLERVIVEPTEKVMAGRDWVQWGDRNQYPHYIIDLYKTVTTLRSIINGVVDYVAGDVVSLNAPAPYGENYFNAKGDTAEDIVRKTAKSIAETGGYAWQIIRRKDGKGLAEMYVLPMENIRSNEDNTVFYYSEKWAKSGMSPVLIYPKWMKDARTVTSVQTKNGEKEEKDNLDSVFYFKMWGEGVYPEPLYAASIKDCEIERGIDEYHLGNLERGFMASYIINFNNGQPSDEIKKQIEKAMNDKFGGKRNAGRIVYSWNKSLQSKTTVEKIETSDFAEKYAALSKHARQQLFTAFRANPNLFGIPTENLGFSSEEYESAFKLFNRTTVRPIQKAILRGFDKVLDMSDSVTIKPFTLEGEKEDTVRGEEA